MNNGSNVSNLSTTSSGTPLTYTINYVIVPIIYIVGFFGNIVCLYILLRQVKTNKGFRYQVVVVLNDLIGTIASTFFRFGSVWYPLLYNGGPDSLRSNVIIMGYTAYFSVSMTIICHFVALTVTLIITVDRMLAFYKPFYYKTINKDRMFVISVSVALVFSVLVAVPDFLKYNLVRKNQLYILEINWAIVNNPAYQAFAYIRLTMRFILVIMIIVLNIIVVRTYRQIRKKPVNQNRKTATVNENTLALFLVLHSCVLSLGQLPLAVACVPISLDPTWPIRTWIGKVSVDVINTLGAVQWAGTFVCYIGVSHEFRVMMKKSFATKKCCCKLNIPSNVYSLTRMPTAGPRSSFDNRRARRVSTIPLPNIEVDPCQVQSLKVPIVHSPKISNWIVKS